MQPVHSIILRVKQNLKRCYNFSHYMTEVD